MASAIFIYTAALQSEFINRRLVLLALVVLLAACGFSLLLLRWLILPALAALCRPAVIGMCVVSLLFGLLLVTFLPTQLQPLMLSPTKLDVSVDGTHNLQSSGSSVTLLAFSTGNRFISYNTFTPSGEWQRNGTALETDGRMATGLAWQGRLQQGELVFRSCPGCGIVQVTWDGQVTRLDTYAPEPGELVVRYQRKNPWPISALTWLCAGAAVGGLYLGLLALVLLAFGTPSPKRPANASLQPPSRGFYAGMLFLGLLSAAIFLVATTKTGLLVETDTTSYLSAGRHLAAGEGYIAMDGDTYVWWPPLYPAVLAPLCGVSRFGALELNRWLNALLLMLATCLSGCIARRVFQGTQGFFWPGMLLFVLARPLLISFSSAMSEPLYLVLQAVFLLYLVKYLQEGKAFDAAASALAAALCSLTRYIGVYLLPVAGLVFLLTSSISLQRRVVRTLAFGLAAGFPLALWVGRNWLMAGTLTGPRSAAELSLGENLASLAATISGWYTPLPAVWTTRPELAIPVALLWTSLAVYGMTARNRKRGLSARTLALFGLAYAIAITAYLSILTNAAINDRILAPLHLPLTILLMAGLQRAWSSAINRRPVPVRVIIALILPCMLFPPARLAWQFTHMDPMQSITNQGFAFRALQNSSLAGLLRNNPPARTVPFYSNCPRCLYVYADIQPSALMDGRVENNIYLPEKIQPFLLFWFDQVAPVQTRTKPKGLPDLSALTGTPLSIQQLEKAEDGQVYYVEPAQP